MQTKTILRYDMQIGYYPPAWITTAASMLSDNRPLTGETGRIFCRQPEVEENALTHHTLENCTNMQNYVGSDLCDCCSWSLRVRLWAVLERFYVWARIKTEIQFVWPQIEYSILCFGGQIRSNFLFQENYWDTQMKSSNIHDSSSFRRCSRCLKVSQLHSFSLNQPQMPQKVSPTGENNPLSPSIMEILP